MNPYEAKEGQQLQQPGWPQIQSQNQDKVIQMEKVRGVSGQEHLLVLTKSGKLYRYAPELGTLQELFTVHPS